MKIFICFAYIVTCVFCSCDMKNNDKFTMKTVCEHSARKPLYSSSTLRDTKWIADYSTKDDEYHIRFTDSLYICTKVLFGRVSEYINPYYLSAMPERKFDRTKVGKKQNGDYLIFYSYNGYEYQTKVTELIYMSPTKLFMVRNGNDTISFTRQ